MAKNKKVKKAVASKEDSAPKQGMVFGKDNYKWMLIGLAVILLGFILMYGKTDDIYSSSEALRNSSFSFSTHMKITIAPIVVLLGFIIEIFAIMKKPQASE